MKITETNWKKCKEYLPENLFNEIEEDFVCSNIKFESVVCEANMNDGTKKQIKGYKLDDNLILHKKDNSRLFTITHLESGLDFGFAAKRQEMVKFYNEIKDLRIDRKTNKTMHRSPDFKTLGEIAKKHRDR